MRSWILVLACLTGCSSGSEPNDTPTIRGRIVVTVGQGQTVPVKSYVTVAVKIEDFNGNQLTHWNGFPIVVGFNTDERNPGDFVYGPPQPLANGFITQEWFIDSTVGTHYLHPWAEPNYTPSVPLEGPVIEVMAIPAEPDSP